MERDRERGREENWMEEGGFARERDCDLIGEFEKGRNVLNSIFFRVCARIWDLFLKPLLFEGVKDGSRVSKVNLVGNRFKICGKKKKIST